MSHDEQLVGRFYNHLTRWFVLRQSVAAVTVWAFLWGTAILVLKATQGTSVPTLAWGAIGLPLALGFAVWSALRSLPDRNVVRALLDGRGECGGLLMAGAECDLGRWQAKPAAEMPTLRWRAQRPLGFLTLAIVFVALGFLIPARSLAVNDTPLDINRPADRLADQVRVLQEEKILDPDRAENLKQKIEELRSQSTGKDPAKALEALDHLNDVVRQVARQAAEKNSRQANQLGRLDAAAEALQKAAAGLDPQEAAELMKELAALAQKAATEGDALESELGAELAEALKEGKLTSEQLAKLAAAAKSGKGSISKMGKKLYNAKLIDADQLKACEGGQCDSDALAKYLVKNKKTSLKEGLKDQEGNGGLGDDGPGNTALNFGDRANEDGTKFKEEALPPSELSALKESQLSGVSKLPPKRDTNAGAPQSGGLTGAAVGGGSANAAPVLPQHRGAVGRYFDRPVK
ncbi:Uncharacterized protein (Fragment) OS=uncultured bacterium GN=ACD_39C01427G0001 PE=4 SV=1 [Gemmata massiliana]|uniref:Uncharacterized protein n=1 Tax=Gemmata massiliana TaxID=1210884 RepID=A0A6P2D2B4_9BACT